ncbi:MAG: DUF1996 domain-containing protein, partial [Sporichthyaceae bacterium]|nr:DUF1996 domain-containing protein [Sporichthyaceae bacterium]
TKVAPDDPIVFPGQPGRSHLHMFYGATGVDANTTTRSLINGTSNCEKGMNEPDRAGYWAPVILRNGEPVTEGPGDHFRVDAYYSAEDKPLPVQPLPLGLRVIAGDSKATSPQPSKIVHFNCTTYPNGREDTTNYTEIPSCPSTKYLSAKVLFPGCWDGKNLDSADHKSHMAYPVKGNCVAPHSVRVPSMILRIRWKTVRGVPGRQLSFSSGGQYSLHADLWNAWSPPVQQWLVDNCVNKNKNCSNIDRSQIPVAATWPNVIGDPTTTVTSSSVTTTSAPPTTVGSSTTSSSSTSSSSSSSLVTSTTEVTPTTEGTPPNTGPIDEGGEGGESGRAAFAASGLASVGAKVTNLALACQLGSLL